jgi:hypothetical protein
VLSGSVEANLPSAVDKSGALVYTKNKLDIMQNRSYYVRAVYGKSIDKKTRVRVNASVSDLGQYRLMNEIIWSIN